MHLDDEVARILGRIGVSEGFLARSRPGSGLRLLDASHRVMAEFSRGHQASQHGFPQADAGRIDVRLADGAPPAGMRALTANPALTVIVRPDRVIGAAGTRSRLPRLPWHIPATAGAGRPAAAPPLAHPDPAGPLPTAH